MHLVHSEYLKYATRIPCAQAKTTYSSVQFTVGDALYCTHIPQATLRTRFRVRRSVIPTAGMLPVVEPRLLRGPRCAVGVGLNSAKKE